MRHNLDFIHIEKNICDNIVYPLLHDKSISKDNKNARKDLIEMGIRRDLWQKDNEAYNLAVFSLMTNSKSPPKSCFLQLKRILKYQMTIQVTSPNV